MLVEPSFQIRRKFSGEKVALISRLSKKEIAINRSMQKIV
ncbi:hypothetical protein V6Z11_D10G244100 [Gossypium hirsutum]